MSDELLNRIKKRLSEPLPGESAQYELAPGYRQKGTFPRDDQQSYRQSAVMALLCRRREGEWFLPLTLRRAYPGVHSAQVSLPGGKFDKNDDTLSQTALRECHEEIGLSDGIEILGALSPLHIPVSRFIVQPFVGVCHVRDLLYHSHEREVEAIIETPLSVLVDEKNLRSGEVAVDDDRTVTAPYFLIGGHKVWGATAMILSELKSILRETL